MEVEKAEVDNLVEKFVTVEAVVKETIKGLQEKLDGIQQESADMEKRTREHYEKVTVSRIRKSEEEFLDELNEIEAKAAADFKEFKQEYLREYAKKSEVKKNRCEILGKTIDDHITKEKDMTNKNTCPVFFFNTLS